MMGCEYGTSIGDGGDDAPKDEERFEAIGSDVGNETMQPMNPGSTYLFWDLRYIRIDLRRVYGPTLSKPVNEKNREGKEPSCCTDYRKDMIS